MKIITCGKMPLTGECMSDNSLTFVFYSVNISLPLPVAPVGGECVTSGATQFTHQDPQVFSSITVNPVRWDPSGGPHQWLYPQSHHLLHRCNPHPDTPLCAHMQTPAHTHLHTHTVEEFPLRKHPRPRTQTQKPTSWCSAVGRSDKSIWGKLSVRNFRSNCRGQNWLLGRANPAAWGWGTMGGECVDVRPVAGEGQWTD